MLPWSSLHNHSQGADGSDAPRVWAIFTAKKPDLPPQHAGATPVKALALQQHSEHSPPLRTLASKRV